MTDTEMIQGIRTIVIEIESGIRPYENPVTPGPIPADMVRALKSMGYERIREIIEGASQ